MKITIDDLLSYPQLSGIAEQEDARILSLAQHHGETMSKQISAADFTLLHLAKKPKSTRVTLICWHCGTRARYTYPRKSKPRCRDCESTRLLPPMLYADCKYEEIDPYDD